MVKRHQQNIVFICYISLFIILVDSGFNCKYFTEIDTPPHKECSNTPNHIESIHTHCLEDLFILSNSKFKTKYLFNIDFVFPLFNDTVESFFLASIWQPPKIV